ncbi:MAG: hypothetical protein PHR52_10460 [Fermentimonas sp.]|nr:hypothetical protein [Fermentimonas sp.]
MAIVKFTILFFALLLSFTLVSNDQNVEIKGEVDTPKSESGSIVIMVTGRADGIINYRYFTK